MSKKIYQQSEEPRVVLDVEDIHVDANPMVVASVVHNLVSNKGFRDIFAEDPINALAEFGIYVPEGKRAKLTPANIDRTLESLKEQVGKEVAFAPGVAVGVRVGTSPGVRVGVNAGVESAVATAVVAKGPTGRGLKKRR